MKVYKGTGKDMKCRGFQYELGVTVKSDDAIRCGNKGFHSCEAPFDVLRYYPNKDGNRFFVATAGGKIDRTDADDSKIASSELTLDKEISFDGLVRSQIEYTRKKAKSDECGGDMSNLAGGDRSNLAGRDWSNLAGGDWSNLAGGNGSNLASGYSSNLAGGNSSIIIGRNKSRAKAGMNSVIVLTEWERIGNEYKPVSVKAEIVDGERIKPDTWYKLIDGEFVEDE